MQALRIVNDNDVEKQSSRLSYYKDKLCVRAPPIRHSNQMLGQKSKRGIRGVKETRRYRASSEH